MHNILFNMDIMAMLMVKPIHFERLTKDIKDIFFGFGFTFIEMWQSLKRSEAKEAHIIDIQNPQIAAGKHKIDSLIDLLTKLNMLDIHLDIFHSGCKIRVSRWHQSVIPIVQIHLDPMPKNINWIPNNYIIMFGGLSKAKIIVDFFWLLIDFILIDIVFVNHLIK